VPDSDTETIMSEDETPTRSQHSPRLSQAAELAFFVEVVEAVVRHHEIDRFVDQRKVRGRGDDGTHVVEIRARRLGADVLAHPLRDVERPNAARALGHRKGQEARPRPDVENTLMRLGRGATVGVVRS
jgi:hypothetical protein